MAIMRYIIVSFVGTSINVILVMMLVSAVMSWISPVSDSVVMRVINGIVYLIVAPARALLMNFEFVRDFPLDISFYLTGVVLVMLRSFILQLL